MQDLGSAGGQRPLGADVVLNCNRNTGQCGQFLPGGALPVHRFRLRQRSFFGDGYITLHLVFHCCGAGENVLRQLDR